MNEQQTKPISIEQMFMIIGQKEVERYLMAQEIEGLKKQLAKKKGDPS